MTDHSEELSAVLSMDFAARAHAAFERPPRSFMGLGKFSIQAIHLAEVFYRQRSAGTAFSALVTAQEDSNRAASTAIALERASIHAAKG
ncbi:hypothetical protein AB7008_19970 [Bradyrhizobium sp. 521_C7_N1_3]|uniref:hypothetical protein n=1 Tax=Bradyrhizobium TaxID=374 RepID=UPI002714A6C1|nr:hypothetical protein [Bradyrhizobium japonicum]WLB51154.1 hypothetical protein QIH94_27780 [Bradyrhizobium japonicum]WLB67072.1 hypothetical protein QIH96_18545 [Bradyrhizobium japonicum]